MKVDCASLGAHYTGFLLFVVVWLAVLLLCHILLLRMSTHYKLHLFAFFYSTSIVLGSALALSVGGPLQLDAPFNMCQRAVGNAFGAYTALDMVAWLIYGIYGGKFSVAFFVHHLGSLACYVVSHRHATPSMGLEFVMAIACFNLTAPWYHLSTVLRAMGLKPQADMCKQTSVHVHIANTMVMAPILLVLVSLGSINPLAKLGFAAIVLANMYWLAQNYGYGVSSSSHKPTKQAAVAAL